MPLWLLGECQKGGKFLGWQTGKAKLPDADTGRLKLAFYFFRYQTMNNCFGSGLPILYYCSWKKLSEPVAHKPGNR
jgi:hypothetical protein